MSNPVITIDTYNVDIAVESVDQMKKEPSFDTAPPIKDPKQPVAANSPVHGPAKSLHSNHASRGNMIDGIRNIANVAKEFSHKHPVLTNVVEVGAGIAVTAVAGKAINTKIRVNPPGRTGHRLPSSQTLKAATELVVETAGKFDFKKSESMLKQLGYTVAKSIGLSDIDRQKILQKIITTGKMSKEAVGALLENNIKLHKNQNLYRSCE